MTAGVSGPATQERSGLARLLGLSALGNVSNAAALLVTAPLLAHGLGVSGRGALAAALAPYLLATTIGTLGMPDAVTHAVATGRGSPRLVVGALVTVAVFGCVLVAAVYAARSAFAHGDGDVEGALYVATLAIIPVLFVSVMRGLAAGREQWGRVAVERVFGGIFRAAPLLLLAVTFGVTLRNASLVMAFGPALAGIAYLTKTRLSFGTTTMPQSFGRDAVPFGLKVWIGAVAGILLMRLDQALMAVASTATQLGLYAVAANVSEVPLVAQSAFREVMFTRDAIERDDANIVRAARSSILVCVAIAVVVAGSSPLWVRAVFGAGFAGALSSIYLLSAAVVVGVPGSVAGSALSARGRPELRSLALICACIVNALLLLALVPNYGAGGAAAATLVGNLVSSNMNIYFFCRLSACRVHHFYAIGVRDLAGLMGAVRRLSSGGR